MNNNNKKSPIITIGLFYLFNYYYKPATDTVA